MTRDPLRGGKCFFKVRFIPDMISAELCGVQNYLVFRIMWCSHKFQDTSSVFVQKHGCLCCDP